MPPAMPTVGRTELEPVSARLPVTLPAVLSAGFSDGTGTLPPSCGLVPPVSVPGLTIWNLYATSWKPRQSLSPM